MVSIKEVTENCRNVKKRRRIKVKKYLHTSLAGVNPKIFHTCYETKSA